MTAGEPSHGIERGKGAGKTALVLGGGGIRGGVEVGLYRAMVELGWPIDMIVGSSVGAVNGAFIAGGLSPEALRQEWLHLRTKDLYDWNLRLFWRGIKENSLLEREGFRRFLHRRLPEKRFERLGVPLTVVATNLNSGRLVTFTRGDLPQALMASTAIPLVFPPVDVDGQILVDGSVTDDLPIDVAVQRGATTVICMVTEDRELMGASPSGLLAIHSKTYQAIIDQKFRRDVRDYQSSIRLIAVKTVLPFSVGLFEVARGSELMELGYRAARDILTFHAAGRERVAGSR